MECENQPEANNVIGQIFSNADILRFLMDFLTKLNKLPEVVPGERTDPEQQVMYDGELQRILQEN